MSDYTELRPGETFDLSTQVIGLDRTTGKAVLMAPTKGPPRRLDGYTVGAPMLTGDAPHDGEMHPDADEVLYLLSGRMATRSWNWVPARAWSCPGVSGTRSPCRNRDSSFT
jgi:hypothetical protein